jgi:hypothetical protein
VSLLRDHVSVVKDQQSAGVTPESPALGVGGFSGDLADTYYRESALAESPQGRITVVDGK